MPLVRKPRACLDGGPATWNEHLLLFLHRRGFLEETYWTFSYSPARDDSGAVGGILVHRAGDDRAGARRAAAGASA